MGESYSVKAVLSAADKNFSSTLKAAAGYADNLKNVITSGFGFGAMMAVGQKAVSVVSNGVSGLVGEMNAASAAWKTFQGNMEMNGKAVEEIQATKKELQSFAEQTIYSSSDMASTFAQLEAVGTKNTTKLVKGFGGLASAAENPTQAMKTLSQQATQMAAKPKVAWEDFKLVLEQTPAGIAAVAKEMGMSTQDMIKNVQDGKVATEDFFDAIAKVGNNENFTKLATQYKTVDQAMDGLTETLSNKLSPAFDAVSAIGISSIDKLINKMGSLDGEAIAGKVVEFVGNAKKYWDIFKEDVSEVALAFGSAVGAIVGDLTEITGAFGSTKNVENFADVMDVAKNALVKFAGFLEEHSEVIAKVLSELPKLLLAYQGFRIVGAIAPGVKIFTGAILGLAGKGISALAGKLFGIAAGQKAVGSASAESGAGMLKSAAAFMAMGVGIALAAAGLGILAYSAVQIAESGPAAAGVLLGMVVALGALMVVAKSVAPALTAGAAGLLAFGGAVVLAGAGMLLLTTAAVSLANAGPLAIGVMVGLVAVVALLAAGAAALGPALTVGAVGFIAFGVAIVLVATGALIAGAALAIVAAVLPTIVQYGLQGAVAIAALGAGMLVFAAGAALAGVGCVALGAGLMIVAVGLGLVGAAVMVAAAGVLLLSAGAVTLGAALLLTGAALLMMAAVLPTVAAGAVLSTAALAALLAVSAGLAAGLVAMGLSLAAVGLASAASAIGIAAFALAMTTGAVGVGVMALALKAVNSSMKSIASNAKNAQKSLSSMKASVSFVNEGLDALGNKAKSAINALVSQFSRAEEKAKSSGKAVGNHFNTGVSNGMQRAVVTADAMSVSVVATMRSASGGAFSSGVYIGQGLANGMRSQLGYVRSVAAQLASAAEAAIRAKAKIHSPSKVSTKLGGFWGIGYAEGILDQLKRVWQASMELVNIPSLAVSSGDTIRVSSGTRELNDNYQYTPNAKYTIIVPLEVEGREIARATAVYTKEELDDMKFFENYRKGYR